MRLHALRMTAFGPFADTQAVNFDALAADGLFLLRGATGAGKTSVLDAVCYALYGTVPGSRPRTRLRSDHARPDAVTEVVLEVTLGGRRLEITRRPEQLRAKKRGSGSTTEKAQTLLREWSAGEWRASSKSHQEVGLEVQRLLGMSREQFCQVVLLPQGEFARFLHSGAAERADLLGRLFDTARFGAVEDWLMERRQRSEKACQAVRGEISALIERVREAAGPRAADPAVAEGVGPDAEGDALGWAAQLRVHAREELAVAECGQAGAAARRGHAAERAAAVRVLADRQRRHAAAVRRSHELEQQAPQQHAAVERLEQAQRAAAVAPLLLLREQAERELHGRRERERGARALLPQALRAAGAEELAAAEHAAREELGGLRALLPAEEQYHDIGRQQAQAEAEREDAEARQAEAEGWLAAWPEQRREVEARVAQAQQAAGQVARFSEQLAEAERRCGAAEQARALRARLASEAEREQELNRAADRARADWLDLRERRLDGMAAELAERLAPGGACPVCGSAEHPQPARPGPDQVTQAQEQQADRAQQAARRAAEAALDGLQQLRQEVAALAAVAGDLPAGELRQAADALAAEHERAQRQAAAGVRAQEDAERLEREHGHRVAEAGRAATDAATASARLQALGLRRAELAAELERGRAGAGSVAARVAELDLLAEQLGAAAEAARAATAGALALERAEADARAAAEREGFADCPAAAAAALAAERAAALREGVQRHRDELARVGAELGDAELLAAARQPVADPQADAAALDAAEGALRRAHTAVSAAAERCAALDRLGAALEQQQRRLAPLAAGHATLSALAALASGTSSSNTLRMSLETYVLAARLEQVAAAAGARLAVMSQGRYTLAHSDARARGGGRSGLGLTVLDAWTGQERDTSTLSGGESFFASLALALGLADVVTDEAGGMPLDTLFIDEGFGSLDEETLEQVLDVLDRLRERDRAVGIVSHVADLRDRVPAQLEVRKGRSGSVLRQRDGGSRAGALVADRPEGIN
ncbi:SMC family ATPase [Streptacidiphilus sp. PB12-B1b]|uniref:AAA family ATPase n=1 Tax=Streptacidiphilus sp. PB12-B1b TaxID=2705012 RepID=UPI0015FC9D0E|nr:SMC family ATPase [Streptacidiphilus sp. PB12-B1b]QMU77579.1 SMC family ATPase [Streptacidiphilus sp. PB12-B1b]